MLPVATMLLSGAQLTASTQLVCPFSVCNGVPVSQSHIRAVQSPLPVAMRDAEKGENCVANMAWPWPGIVAEQRETAFTLKTA
jgi:hypothetical protein